MSLEKLKASAEAMMRFAEQAPDAAGREFYRGRAAQFCDEARSIEEARLRLVRPVRA